MIKLDRRRQVVVVVVLTALAGLCSVLALGTLVSGENSDPRATVRGILLVGALLLLAAYFLAARLRWPRLVHIGPSPMRLILTALALMTIFLAAFAGWIVAFLLIGGAQELLNAMGQ